MAKRKQNELIVIIALHQPDLIRPFVLNDPDTEQCATYASVNEIQRVKNRHILGEGEWTAFNFVTGETEGLL